MFFSGLAHFCCGAGTRSWSALILPAGLCFGVTQMVPPSYEIKAMMLVLPPKSTAGKGGNPFLALGGLGSVADVVSRAMMDGNTVKSLVAMGADDKFQVIQDATSAGPVILITSSGHSPAESGKTLRIVKEQIPIKLLKLQKATRVPERSLITVNLLSQDETPPWFGSPRSEPSSSPLPLGIGLTPGPDRPPRRCSAAPGARRTAPTRDGRGLRADTAPRFERSHPNGAAHGVLAERSRPDPPFSEQDVAAEPATATWSSRQAGSSSSSRSVRGRASARAAAAGRTDGRSGTQVGPTRHPGSTRCQVPVGSPGPRVRRPCP